MIDEEIKKAYSKITKQYETKSDRVSYKDAKTALELCGRKMRWNLAVYTIKLQNR